MRCARVFIVVALLAATLTGVAAGATGAEPVSVYGNAATNRAQAHRAVSALLKELSAGPGARRSSTAPAATLRSVDGRPATPNWVDAHAWFTTTRSPVAVLAYARAHLPTGTERHEGGSEGGSDGVSSLDWPLPAGPGLAGRSISVSVVALAGGGTGVRLDAEALWLTPRPSWERVPSDVVSATVSGDGTTASGRAGPISRPITLDPTRARSLGAFVNRLEAGQPGTYSCPAAFPGDLRILFQGADESTLARADENDSGCASVALSVGTRTGPTLADRTLGANSRTVTQELLALHAVPSCTAAQLALSANASGRTIGPVSTGNVPPSRQLVNFVVTDRSRDLCSLAGLPQVTLSAGATHESRQPRTEAMPTLLRPRGVTSFSMSFDACPSTPAAHMARVSLAGDVTLGVRLTRAVRACGGRVQVSPIS